MPKIRTIKPEFWTDDAIMNCSLPARLFFIGLLTFADDVGIFEWIPRSLKAKIFPSDQTDISILLIELENNSLIEKIQFEGRDYGKITNFSKHQKIDPRYMRVLIPSMTPDNAGLSEEERVSRNILRDPKIRKYIFDRDANKCCKCESIENLTIDHIIPISKNGTNEVNNFQTLCRSCNSSKLNLLHTSGQLVPRRATPIQRAGGGREVEGKGGGGGMEVEDTPAKILANALDSGRRKTNPAYAQKFVAVDLVMVDWWAADIDILIKQDNATFEQIQFVLEWLFTSTAKGALFWRNIIISGEKLREHFQKLVGVMKSETEQNPGFVFIS